jgi:hypothetical protein
MRYLLQANSGGECECEFNTISNCHGLELAYFTCGPQHRRDRVLVHRCMCINHLLLCDIDEKKYEPTSAQRDLDPDRAGPAGFINPESRPKAGIYKFAIRVYESVRDPVQCGTILFSVT